MKWTYLKGGEQASYYAIFYIGEPFSLNTCKHFGLYYWCRVNGIFYESKADFGSDFLLYIKIPTFSDAEIKIPEGFTEITENEYINAMKGI